MSKASRDRRIRRLSDFRHLTDSEAADLLAVPKEVREPIVWTPLPNGTPGACFTVPVANPRAERLSLGARVLDMLPGQSHWRLTWGDKRFNEATCEIRRLDLRDVHVNPDGQRWNDETHKHLWSEVDGNDFAYSPSDIPHDPAQSTVTPDDYRAVFEAFAAEVNIGFGDGYRWTDMPARGAVAPQLWEVP